MGAARDRQELGEPLDDAKDDGLEEFPHGRESYGGHAGPSPGREAGGLISYGEPTARRHALWLPCRHGAAVGRLDRTQGVAAGSGNHDVGQDTDEHEARDQLVAFADRRDPRRHRRRLRRRRLRGAARQPPRRRRRPRRGRARHQGRISASKNGRRYDVSRGHLLSTLDASLRVWASATSTCGRCIWSDDTPLEETLSALDLAVTSGRASYVGSRTTPAGRPRRPRPGSAPCPAGRCWPPPRWSTRCSTATSSTRCCRPRRRWASACSVVAAGPGVLTGKYRSGTPSDSGRPPRTSRTSSGLPRRPVPPGRRGRGPGRRRPRLDPARGVAGLGARPPRCHRPDRGRPHRCPAAAPWASRPTLPPEIVEALDDVSGE